MHLLNAHMLSMTELMMNEYSASRKRQLLLPLFFSVIIIALDQISKALIAANVPENSIAYRFFGDFLWIVHTRNLGIAFSIGDSLSRLLRFALFVLLPSAFLIAAAIFYFRSTTLTNLQRYAIALIMAGGFGNLLDRVFRPNGVVDFISFSMFGLLGFERFPTFNIADSSVTIGAIMLLITGFLWEKGGKTNA